MSLSRSIKLPLLLVGLINVSLAHADSLLDDMNSLGGNKKLVKMARDIDPNNKVRIVQNRLVDRNLRLELGVNYGAFQGGDPYLNTDQLGAALDFHVNPYISIGMRYFNHSSSLSAEGQRKVDEGVAARALGNNVEIPQGDVPFESYLGVINIYPTYGKLNMLNLSVVHFDVYLLGGGGQIRLDSGYTDTYTAGGGIGMWWTQHLTSRFEARYQTYESNPLGQSRQVDTTVFSATLGVML